jgi:hypothetical protein
MSKEITILCILFRCAEELVQSSDGEKSAFD